MSGTLTFAPGMTTQTVRVSITDNDTAENIDSFFLALSESVNAVIANTVA